MMDGVQMWIVFALVVVSLWLYCAPVDIALYP